MQHNMLMIESEVARKTDFGPRARTIIRAHLPDVSFEIGSRFVITSIMAKDILRKNRSSVEPGLVEIVGAKGEKIRPSIKKLAL